MKRFKLLFGLTLLVLMSSVTIAQDDTKTKEIRLQLSLLCEYSSKYDYYAQLKASKFDEQRSKFEKMYRDQIKKIKHGPDRDLYIQYLNTATGRDSLKYRDNKGHPYFNYYTITARIDRMPTLLEYYKVVKYSLFTMDKEELIHPRDVPFLRYRDW